VVSSRWTVVPTNPICRRQTGKTIAKARGHPQFIAGDSVFARKIQNTVSALCVVFWYSGLAPMKTRFLAVGRPCTRWSGFLGQKRGVPGRDVATGAWDAGQMCKTNPIPARSMGATSHHSNIPLFQHSIIPVFQCPVAGWGPIARNKANWSVIAITHYRSMIAARGTCRHCTAKRRCGGGRVPLR
jgi:hypothetical protein